MYRRPPSRLTANASGSPPPPPTPRRGRGPPAVVSRLARPGPVERLPELMAPPAKRGGLAFGAVERRRRLQERGGGAPVPGARPHHRLADQLERGPRRPRGLGHRRVPPAPEAPVQLAGGVGRAQTEIGREHV